MNNTCFANSVLQCLAHTPILREYCKQARHSKNCFSDFAKLNLVENASEGYQFGVGGDLPNKGNMNPISLMPVIFNALQTPEKFCSFCVLEAHIKGILKLRQENVLCVRPIGIELLYKICGNGDFMIGQQSDAQEFLFSLLDNMT